MNAEPRRGRPARFPDTASAEAWAITKGVPARGTGAAITEATRGPVRFWLTAHGLPSAFVRGLPVADLSAAWHDTTGTTVAGLADRAGTTPTTTTTEPEPMSYQPSMPMPRTAAARAAEPAYASHHEPRASADDAQQLAALLSRMAKPSLDEDAVRALIRDEAPAALTTATATLRQTMQHDLAAAIAKIDAAPRPLAITVNDKPRGTLPALRHKQAEHLARVLGAGVHAFVVGPAGAGKTHAAEQAATALGLAFYMTGAVSGPHELLGYRDAMGTYRGTPFRDAYEQGGVFLFDEIDASDPASLLVINSALANGKQAFPDGVVDRHADFICIACANTYGRGANAEYIGRSALDVATLDRFAFISWDYDEALERTIAGDNTAWTKRVQSLRAAVAAERVRLVISPRASINGARLIAAGLSQTEAEDAVIWRGVAPDVATRVRNAAR